MMKRMLMVLMVFLLLLSAFPVAVWGDEPQIAAEVDERKVNLYTVNLTLDNQYLASDVPPVLFQYQEQYRTLVPVAAIASYAGATVNWNGDTQQVTIEKDDTTIVLTINSAVVKVNGEDKILPSQVPAKIVTYQNRGRTMVPVAFVGQELGLEVGWDEATRTVKITTPEPEETNTPTPETPSQEQPQGQPDNSTGHYGEPLDSNGNKIEGTLKDINVTLEGDVPVIRLKTDSKVDYATARLTEPHRLIFDLNNTQLLMDDPAKVRDDKTVRVTAPGNSYLSTVRSSQFEIDPHVVRVVLDLTDPTGYHMSYDEASGEMVIRLVNYVDDVRFEQFNTKDVLVIEGSHLENYHLQMDGSRRLEVFVKESILNPGRPIADRTIGGRVINSIRVSGVDPDDNRSLSEMMVRIVVDLNKQVSAEDIYVQQRNGQLIIHMEGEPETGYRYEETGWTTSRLTFFGQGRADYQVAKEVGGELIKVTMPSDNMDIPFELLDVDDVMLEFIQMTTSDDGRNLVANIHVKPGVEVATGTLSNVQDLILQFTNRDLKYREKLIVIDAGHGGSDPGAISPNLKLNEKDVNLEVALEARRLLEAAGFRVYMTRTSDVYVGLQDRAGVANQLGADLFISIHANAAARSDLKGVETLYYPSEENPMDFRNNKYLAEIFQDEMVRTLGAASHRINARDKLVVLRETKMPAIIIEMGFLTNPDEERLLGTNEYRRLAAQGIVNSTIRYFEASLTHLSTRP
ncbi:N-acetylmuramoyl-L-alanine amidase family protein [Anoxynatronum buryatiense]|uniref:N-acetylmuramoyl-L-alanine amidase n=1 Tax=Anoxynatronum buryatiense TaxID=489973 RepID=A0AA45WX16_9CLOT|nr:N-acetylmuramoyl-L-alanine amidase family protein [Anoxynatronum buryatiense]SMP62607.1 N-acetylmuramoyl-L-alanine amidase [Anoxynatronum buryatiense]